MNKSTQLLRANAYRKFNSAGIAVIRYVTYFCGAIALALLTVSVLLGINTIAAPVLIFVLGPALTLMSYDIYLRYLYLHPTRVDSNDPYANFDFDATLLLDRWQRKNYAWQSFWQTAYRNNFVVQALLRLKLTDSELAQAVPGNAGEQLYKKLLTLNTGTVGVIEIVREVLNSGLYDPFLIKKGIAKSDLSNVFDYYSYIHDSQRLLKQRFLSGDQYFSGGFADDWAVSFTPLLDQMTSEVTKSILGHTVLTPLWSRGKFVSEIVQLGSKSSGQNILLIGESGSGRTELLLNLAAKIIFKQTKTSLDGKSVRMLNTERLVAIAPDAEKLSAVLNNLFSEVVRAGNVVLIVPRLDNLILKATQNNQLDFVALLATYLKSKEIHIFATVSSEVYIRYFKNNDTVLPLVSAINIPEPSVEDCVKILLFEVMRFERQYSVFFGLDVINLLINTSRQYIKDSPSPSREISLLEDIASRAATHSGLSLVEEGHVFASVEAKSGAVIHENSTRQDSSNLLELESNLRSRVIGQDNAIKTIADALVRSGAGLNKQSKPVGTFLLLGPTGVGKTESAKALAATYFGSEKTIIRFDMAEYADRGGLNKLIGTSGEQRGTLGDAIVASPSSVVLFDELEKASGEVRNILLSLLDEGRVTTGYGKVLDFTNAIVIATSNAGSDFIAQQIGLNQGYDSIKNQLINKLIGDGIFSPELINRFDAVVIYRPLTKENVAQIAQLQINGLAKELWDEKGLELKLTQAVADKLIEQGYDPVFGARALARIINSELRTVIAKKIIATQPQRGTQLLIDTL